MSLSSTDPDLLHIDYTAVADHASWDIALTASQDAALACAQKQVTAQRMTIPYDGGWMRVMAADVASMGIFGYKEFHLAGDNSVRYCVHVFETATGRPLGVVDAALITPLRTAATAAVAVRHLAGEGSALRLGVVGSGAEAVAGVAALNEVVKLTEVRVTSRRESNRAAFVTKVAEQTGLTATPHPNLADALADTDLVYVATNSGGDVVLRAADVRHVPLIASIGSTLPVQRELDGAILSDASRVVVDTPDVLEESGDALDARATGLVADRVELLGTILEHEQPGELGTTVYKSIGSPEQDVVLAAALLGAASKRDFGQRITPLSTPKMNLP
jgi:ornithine cyclodeaminase/alanine dehydrogenase-like protein (mu-crystallin family)